MKTQKKQINLITLLFAIVMFFQSCTVYKSANVTLDQAIQNESKVKVITMNNAKFKFKRIGVEDGNYYGIKKKNNVVIRIPLDQNFVKIIKEKDKPLSTVLSIGIPLVIAGGVIAIVAQNCCGFTGGGFGYGY